MQYYADKASSYFGNARKDIAALLPDRACNVLEIGCGSGATLAWLKANGRASTTTGIELFPGAAERARECADTVLCGPAEDMLASLPEQARFDLILCLDVLEHMVDPWAFLELLQRRLAPGGLFIASIPNVRYVGVVMPLLFGGHWRYRDEGILDRTHLRFFTRSSALELMRTGSLETRDCIGIVPAANTKVGRADRMTFGLLREFFAFQWLISAGHSGSSR